jgi:sirohydrochlorin ferrochelatase
MKPKKRALILVDHGSVVKEANDILIEVAHMVRQSSKCKFDIVRYAHMELAEPTISQAFDACVAEGAEEIIVHPYFLGSGRHSTRDIPSMVADAAKKHPHVSYRITEPLGLHPKIIDVVLERTDNIP